MPIQTLAQQFKESLERHKQDPGRSETPVSLYDKRRNFSYNAKYNRVPPNAQGRKLYQEMQAKREKERGVKEQTIKEKFGISMKDVESTKKNDIWNKDYVQRRPTTLSSQATRHTPSWLKLAAEKSDVTGLMAAYARRHEVESSKPQEDNYISEARRRGDSFHGLPPAPTPSPLPQQSPYHQYQENNIGYGASNQTRIDVHQGQPNILLHPPQAYQQHQYPENQQLLHVHQPKAHPTLSQHDPDLTQQNSFSFQHQYPLYNNELVSNDQRYYIDQGTARYPALPSISPHSGTASNILPQSWQNGENKTLHSTESISSLQPFDGYTPDATSTPQRDNRFLKAPHYPSSGSTHSQQPFYPESGGSALDRRHGAIHSIPDPLYKAQQYPTTSMNIPQHNPMSNQEQYSQTSSTQQSRNPRPDRTVLLNDNPYYQASILTSKNGEHQVRFRSTPEVFFLPPQSHADLPGNLQDGSGMTPIPSQQVRQTYQDIHSRHSIPLPHPQPSPGWTDNTATSWYQPVSGPLPVHEQAANIDSAPPAGLQQAHEEIVKLRKAKRQKKSSQSGKAQRLSAKVVNDLERIADETVDELDLLRRDMLSLDDQPQGVISMASDHTHLSAHPSSPRERCLHRSSRTQNHGWRPNTYHPPHSHHDEYYTDDTETGTDGDSYTSDNFLSSMEDDDAYIPSAHSHGSRGYSRSHHSDSSSHSQRTKRSSKRRRTTSKYHRRKYGSQRRKRPRYTHSPSGRYERFEDTTEDSTDTSDQTHERYDPDVDIDIDEDMEVDHPLPQRQKVPKPVKPLSAIANTVRLPHTTKSSKPKPTTRRQANVITQVRKAQVPITNATRRKRNIRIPSPAQTVLGEDIEEFSDDQDEEQDDDEVIQDDTDEIQTNKVKARGRWLRDYEERDRLSTVEEENEEQEDKTEAHGGDSHREHDGVQLDERTEEDKFWGEGGDLGFKIWRDGY